MEKLRLEETVYSLQPTTGDETVKIIKIKIDETSTNSKIQYMESRNNKLICQKGNRMSYLLRHGSTNEQGNMESKGYVTMTALLHWLNKDLHHQLDTEDVTWIVDNNDKVRFSIYPKCGVKSSYGHSLELPEMVMEEYKEDTKRNKRYIVHETYNKYLPKILTEGLSRMDRNHVHLCKQIGGTWIRRKIVQI